jgi:hypothetical protein
MVFIGLIKVNDEWTHMHRQRQTLPPRNPVLATSYDTNSRRGGKMAQREHHAYDVKSIVISFMGRMVGVMRAA